MCVRSWLGPPELHIISAVLVLLAGCSHSTDPFVEGVPPDVVAFVRAEVSKPREIRSVYDDPSQDLLFFSVGHGEPQDCPSGCFYLGGWGLKYRGRIGWTELQGGPAGATFWDFREDDAGLYAESLWDGLRGQYVDFHFRRRMVCDLDTPPAVLLRLAERLIRDGSPQIARVLLSAAQRRDIRRIAEVIAALDPAQPGYAYERDFARSALNNWPGAPVPAGCPILLNTARGLPELTYPSAPLRDDCDAVEHERQCEAHLYGLRSLSPANFASREYRVLDAP